MQVLELIKKSFGQQIKDIKIHNQRRIYIEIAPQYLRAAADFLFNKMKMRFSIASGVDEKDYFEIVYHFSLDEEGIFFNLKVKCDREKPKVDTISDIITGAKWIEREIYELLGIEFEGNNDMRPLVLSENYKGKRFPLRKDD